MNPRYSHPPGRCPTSAPIEQRAQQAGARRWHYLDNLPVLVESGGLGRLARSCACTVTRLGRTCGVPYWMREE